jgi:hypothetical protein
MAQFRSERQRKAVMASLRRRAAGLWGRLSPFRPGLSKAERAQRALGLAGLAGLATVLGRVTLGPRIRPETLAHMHRTAGRLYRGVRRTQYETANLLLARGGGVARVPLTNAHTLGALVGRALRRVWPRGRRVWPQMRRSLVVVPERASPALFAHELGHATAAGPGRFEALRRRLIAVPYETMAGVIPAGLLASEGLQRLGRRQERTGLRRGLMVAGAALPTVLAAPVLAEEALASGRGLRILRHAGMPAVKLVPAAGLLGAAYATYLGGLGGVTLKQWRDAARAWRRPERRRR